MAAVLSCVNNSDPNYQVNEAYLKKWDRYRDQLYGTNDAKLVVTNGGLVVIPVGPTGQVGGGIIGANSFGDCQPSFEQGPTTVDTNGNPNFRW